ncbi:hypothetical protein SAMN05444008_108180 [Cnuella takakiae]|uniref:DUF4369 domain-containing protein n=1 Tax=Cnuella takakiae TaxID=1302690 RepID=A0A1M5C0Z7_9BACT|nr:hypothetical protein [Cnuella takakiae]OLY93580.1 hypothetical protein BUE76_18150 [Cnuella takakiae]SHF48287.1 hypothetical protein SAMN05444008_108180 [Cnuella takakiae]
MTAFLRIGILLFFGSFLHSANAQSTSDSINREMLLFPEFVTGKVLMKNGAMETTPLNYNIEQQNIVFIQNRQYLLLTGLELVDTVYLQGRRFLPVGTRVCELVATEGPYHLLATYAGKLVPLTATADHGGIVQKANNEVSNTVTGVYVSRNYKSRTQMQAMPHFWIEHKGSLAEIDSRKQLLKAVRSELRPSVQAYLDSHPVNFTQAADMRALLQVVAKADAQR